MGLTAQLIGEGGRGMSIQAIDDWKNLKKYGAKLGRKELAERVLECVECMQKDSHYQGVIEFVGRMKAIAQACSYDSYWDEKVHKGFHTEMHNLYQISEGKEHRYYGYCGKNMLTHQER